MGDRGICPGCGRERRLTSLGRVFHHWVGGQMRRGGKVCRGGGQKPVVLPPPPTPPILGNIPLSGDRLFTYTAPNPLQAADVVRIAYSLFLHVDGFTDEAWAAAVAAGLVVDLPQLAKKDGAE